MKQLLFLLLLPTLMFGQVSSWRSGGTTAPRQSTGGYSQPNMGGSSFRNQPRYNNNYTNRYYGNPYYGGYYGGLYPWYNGFGYYNMLPYYYYDNYGYRQRGRIRVYENGKRDTLHVKPMRYAFGLQKSTSNDIGGWLAIGHEGYFLLEYQQTNQPHPTLYFPYGHLGIVDFPLTSDWSSNRILYAGLGRRYGRNGLHVSLGIGNEEVRFQGKDAIGYITFPKYSSNFITAKFGVIHDFKYTTIKLDYDPIRNTGIFGIGINL
jgi:hypothetical protein